MKELRRRLRAAAVSPSILIINHHPRRGEETNGYQNLLKGLWITLVLFDTFNQFLPFICNLALCRYGLSCIRHLLNIPQVGLNTWPYSQR